MLIKNLFQLDPGLYKHKGTGMTFVVTEITTHEYVDADQKEREHPLVTFRDLIMKHEKYVTYSMILPEFKEKFERI